MIEVPKWVDTTTPEFSKDIGVKLEKLLRLGFHLQQSQHFGQPGAKELPDANGNNPEPPANASLQVEVIFRKRLGAIGAVISDGQNCSSRGTDKSSME